MNFKGTNKKKKRLTADWQKTFAVHLPIRGLHPEYLEEYFLLNQTTKHLRIKGKKLE